MFPLTSESAIAPHFPQYSAGLFPTSKQAPRFLCAHEFRRRRLLRLHHCSGVLCMVCIMVSCSQGTESIRAERMKRSTDNPTLRFAASAIVVSVVVFVYFRWLHVNPATVGFTFLLVILFISAVWGLRYAIVTAVLAA